MKIRASNLYRYLPNINGQPLGNFDEEYDDFIWNRLVATYIPNQFPTDNLVELQKYFIDKVQRRTGIVLDKRDAFINQLLFAARNYHKGRQRINLNTQARCANCLVHFQDGHLGAAVNSFDVLNPGTYPTYSNKSGESFIDHITPISKTGNNESQNLQTLCYICNNGKTNICTPLDKFNVYNERVYIEKVREFKQKELNNIGETKKEFVFLPLSLYYRVLQRDNGCRFCHTSEYSLTIMPVDKDCLYTYDNLITVCYGCLSIGDSISHLRWTTLQ